MSAAVFGGGCHCGALRFRVTVEKYEVINCNCSICVKKGFVHLIATPEQFVFEGDQTKLATYTFNTHIARHHFCAVCGIAPFYRPRSHPNDYSVNLRCLDEFPAIADKFRPVDFNGQEWEANIAALTDGDNVNTSKQ